MSDFKDDDPLFDILFELSNDIRYNILLLILEKPIRMTNIAKKLDLTSPEVSRHLSRLNESKMIQKNLDNYYHVTTYGQQILEHVKDIEFNTKNRDYFVSHNALKIPSFYRKRLSELSEYKKVDFMEFLTFIDNKIKESTDYIWLFIDQYPIIAIDSLLGSVERGVKIRIIEPLEIAGPKVTFDDKHILALGTEDPNVIVRVFDKKDLYLFVSDSGCAVSFPIKEGFDYSGYIFEGKENGNWCKNIFDHYWQKAHSKVPSLSKDYTLMSSKKGKSIIINAHSDPAINSRAIQNAVENYDEVVLKGEFVLKEADTRTAFISKSTTNIKIRKSISIRGEGRKDGIPLTKIRKNSWKFPLNELASIFEVDNEDIDVTFENIHFQDFNGLVILCSKGNSVKIIDNRVTIPNGMGRAITWPGLENNLVGFSVICAGQEKSGFPGGVIIENNYIDFSHQNLVGSFFPPKHANDPEYRPDLEKRESYNSYGIMVINAHGKVIIRNNIIRNMNSRGILVTDNDESSQIKILGNTVFSEIPGCYPQSLHYAGVGILANASYGRYQHSGSDVYISDNDVHCTKLNYCGIAVFGQSTVEPGSGKFGESAVKDNRIHLDDGFVGILIDKNDETEVIGNKVSGRAYYGIHLWGSQNLEGFDLRSSNNILKDNDLSELDIKIPDVYSNNHVDGRMFAGSDGKSLTAHYWLSEHTHGNKIWITKNESVIDGGKENEIVVSKI